MMKNKTFYLSVSLCVVAMLGVSSCGRKQPPVVAPVPESPPVQVEKPAPEPAPTVSIGASPATIERENQTTLRWQSSNATSVVIDNGIGSVEKSGSIVVSPLESTTYTATATGAGGDAKSSTRVTVVPKSVEVAVTSTDLDSLKRAIDEGLVKPIFFPYDKAQLTDESKTVLEANAQVIQKFVQANLVIEGHCDERGTEEYNLALGDRRAQVVKDYLVQLGVSGGRLETISLGEERPFVEGSNESAFSQNRRAHFIVKR